MRAGRIRCDRKSAQKVAKLRLRKLRDDEPRIDDWTCLGRAPKEQAIGGRRKSKGGRAHDRLRSAMHVRESERLSRDCRSSTQPVQLLSVERRADEVERSLLAVASSLRCHHGIASLQPICHAAKTQRTAQAVSRETAAKSRVPFVSDKSVEKRSPHEQNCSPVSRFWARFALAKSGQFWPFAATTRNESKDC